MQEAQGTRARACNPVLTLGGTVSQRAGIAVVGTAVIATGLVLGWDALAALGLTTVIVSVLPCLVMCGLGVCVACRGKNDAGANSVKGGQPDSS